MHHKLKDFTHKKRKGTRDYVNSISYFVFVWKVSWYANNILSSEAPSNIYCRCSGKRPHNTNEIN
jgi:hypothetical protein